MSKSIDIPDRVLFNPKRFAIAVILYLHGPTTMAELQKALNISWGDLDSNIRKLREAGYVETKKVITPTRPKTIVMLTRRGREKLEELLNYLENLLRETRARTSPQQMVEKLSS